MSDGQTPDMLSHFAEYSRVLRQQTAAQEKASQEYNAIRTKDIQSLEQILKINQDLLLISKKSFEKLSYIERRADAAGGEPADIGRHLSQWLREYNPDLSRGDPAILELGLLRRQAAFQRTLEGTKMSATLPAQRAFQVALSIIAERLQLQQTNAILSAQNSRKKAEFELGKHRQHADWLKAIESTLGSKGHTAELSEGYQTCIAEEMQKQTSNISFWQEAERQAIAQMDQTKRTLADPSLKKLLVPKAEVEDTLRATEGLFSVWLRYWKTETTIELNRHSRLEVERDLSEPETVTMNNLAELRKKIAEKTNKSEADVAQESQA